MPSSKSRKNDAMVAYDPEQASRKSRSQNRNRQDPDEDENVSEISEGEYDHDPDDQPRFMYSTAELADSSCRGNNCCLITTGIICIIVAVALSIVMVRVFNDKDEENSAPAPTLMPTTADQRDQPGINLFQGGREFISDNRCDSDNYRTEGCTTACEGFECCDPLLAKNESCFFYNPDGCLDYQRCHVTSSGVGVPIPTIESVCSPDSIASDRAPCEQACAGVKCCWESDVTCYDKFYTCMDYAPCQNLRSGSTVPAATFQVREFCDSTQTGSLTQTDVCDNACQVAECCWSEDPASNCLQDNVLACLTYSPCGQFNITGAGDGQELPPASLSDDCSFTNINGGNTADCQTSCSTGSCCATGSSNSCFLDDPLACLAYEPCEAFYNCERSGEC